MVANKKNLIGKAAKLTINVDPIALKLVLKAAEKCISHRVMHEMMFSGMCCETEDFVAALKEFKKALP